MMRNIAATLLILITLFVVQMLMAAPGGGYRPFRYQPPPPPPQYGLPLQPPQQQHFEAPVIETIVNDTSPYEQQNLIYTIRIISKGDVKTVKPHLPRMDSVVFQPIGDPVSSIDNKYGQRAVTEYRYLLMPLATGHIEIPPVRVTGTHRGRSNNPAYEATSGNPVILEVRPATEMVQPWLPLQKLRLDARLANFDTIEAGKPITLMVEMTTVGATGSQLPSIANLLHSEDFKIYPGPSTTEGRISADGNRLLGRRIEQFTLVPQYGGQLKLLSPRINWWNVNYNRPEVAAFLLSSLKATGPARESVDKPRGDFMPSGGSIFFWLPFIAAIAFLIWGWFNAFFGSGRFPGFVSIRNWSQRVLGEYYAPVAEVTTRVSPRRHFHRFRTWTGRNLPISWKLWFCMRAIAKENDPAEWAHALQILASKHLDVRPNAHLKHLGKSIAACHPRADTIKVDRLMGELDEAVYGDKPIVSFSRWKHDFEYQIKPRLLMIRFRRCRAAPDSSATLPALNPLQEVATLRSQRRGFE